MRCYSVLGMSAYPFKKKCQHTSMPLQVTSSRLICNQDQSQLFHFVRKGNILGGLKALSVPMTSRRERFSASPMPWSITSLPTEWNCGTYLHTYSESLISSTNKIIANCSCHTHIYSSHNSKAHWLGLKTHFNYATSL